MLVVHPGEALAHAQVRDLPGLLNPG